MNDFTALKKKSNSAWNELIHNGEPVIYLGMASCGRAAGADKVKHVILDQLAQLNLSAKRSTVPKP